MTAHARLSVACTAALLTLLSVALSACNLQLSHGVEAKDVWTQKYKVNAGATLDLRENNGTIRVQAVDGSEIEVVATRVAKAPTEEAAKKAAAEMTIRATATADRVELDSTAGFQATMGLSTWVNYEIKMPRSLNLTIKATNSEIDIKDVAGFIRVEAVNGAIAVAGIDRGADIRSVNGQLKLTLASVGEGGIRCRTTNGQIIVTLPGDAKATIAARVSNGNIEVENLPLAKSPDDSYRRLDATLGGGGPEIRLDTTNGQIRLVGFSQSVR